MKRELPDAAALSAALAACGYRPGQTVLAAVSGGCDSVLLAQLLHEAGVPFALAHVNYGLRGAASDGDEVFCAQLAERFAVPIYVHRVSAEEIQGSLQAAARELRYAFFESVRAANGYSFIATAHHVDDAIETLLLQLARGTGLRGAGGIAAVHGLVLRPLLEFTQAQLQAAAELRGLVWRTDSSNATDAYTRNRFRHHLLPDLLAQHPQGHEGFRLSLRLLREAQVLQAETIERYLEKFTTALPNGLCIVFDELLLHPAAATLLFEFLRPFGFGNEGAAQALRLADSQTGARVHSATHTATRNRHELIVSPITEPQPAWQLVAGQHLPFLDQHLLQPPVVLPNDPWQAMLDADSITWPLELRPWQSGDQLQPLGMTGHRNISDILTDLKWPSHTRRNALVLCNNNEPVWLPGFRIDNRCRITPETKQVLHFRFDRQHYD